MLAARQASIANAQTVPLSSAGAQETPAPTSPISDVSFRTSYPSAMPEFSKVTTPAVTTALPGVATRAAPPPPPAGTPWGVDAGAEYGLVPADDGYAAPAPAIGYRAAADVAHGRASPVPDAPTNERMPPPPRPADTSPRGGAMGPSASPRQGGSARSPIGVPLPPPRPMQEMPQDSGDEDPILRQVMERGRRQREHDKRAEDSTYARAHHTHAHPAAYQAAAGQQTQGGAAEEDYMQDHKLHSKALPGSPPVAAQGQPMPYIQRHTHVPVERVQATAAPNWSASNTNGSGSNGAQERNPLPPPPRDEGSVLGGGGGGGSVKAPLPPPPRKPPSQPPSGEPGHTHIRAVSPSPYAQWASQREAAAPPAAPRDDRDKHWEELWTERQSVYASSSSHYASFYNSRPIGAPNEHQAHPSQFVGSLGPTGAEMYDAAREGGTLGIGFNSREGKIVVASLPAGLPAHLDGRIQIGDVLVQVDQRNVPSDLDFVVQMMKGPAGTRSLLTLRSRQVGTFHPEPYHVSLVRAPIPSHDRRYSSAGGTPLLTSRSTTPQMSRASTPQLNSSGMPRQNIARREKGGGGCGRLCGPLL
eukprot:Tamp_08230.p1 GENE.Tamp_08230~~Tamp_08230.p1  ORF type:complete len:587 (-),score=59.29 Tamp_08230:36-1796(-)